MTIIVGQNKNKRVKYLQSKLKTAHKKKVIKVNLRFSFCIVERNFMQNMDKHKQRLSKVKKCKIFLLLKKWRKQMLSFDLFSAIEDVVRG